MSIELPGYVVDAFYFVGLPWPGVDEDQLRGWASDLRAFAEEITAISGMSKNAVTQLSDSSQSVFLRTVAAAWERHHGVMTALRGPMNDFADALDVAATAVEVQKGAVIGAAVALAAEIVTTQGEAVFTLGLAEGEVPLEVAGTKLVIKFALQELENALLGVLINEAAQAISDHLGGTIAELLMGSAGVAGEVYSLKADTEAIRNLAGTMKTHGRRTEDTSSEAHRKTTNRKLETDSPGGRWHVVQILEAALLSIAADLFKRLPGTLFKVIEETEEDLTEAAARIEAVDAGLASDVPDEQPAPTPSGSNPDGKGGEERPGGRRRRSKLPPKDTPEGKEARWQRYQQSVAAGQRRRPLDYDAWSSKYDVAIHQHARADAAVDDYIKRSGKDADHG